MTIDVAYSNDMTQILEIDELTAKDLIGVAEIAERLSLVAGRDITRTNVSTWIWRRDTQQNGFPLPITTLRMGGVYSWVEILDWYDAKIGRSLESEPK
jgi:hypothetical protein